MRGISIYVLFQFPTVLYTTERTPYVRYNTGELRRSCAYRGFQVVRAKSEFANNDVIRVMIIYKKSFSIDALLSYVHLPYSFSDIVPELSFDFNSSILLEDIGQNFLSVLNSITSVKVNVRCTYWKDVLLALLEVMRCNEIQ